MIYVNRRKAKMPKILKGKGSKGIVEKFDSINFYENAIGNKPDFKIYKDDTVKRELIKLFNGKCAYCEREIMDVSFGNIEHFRPKGDIKYGNGTFAGKGYYWLGSDWYNLLLACSNCNVFHSDIEDNTVKYGKGNYFPLLPGFVHSSREQGIRREEHARLLINPTVDEPNDYLDFDVENGTVKEKITNQLVRERGKKTIEIFGLDKRVCTQAREMAAMDFWKDVNEIISAAKLLDLIDVTNIEAKEHSLETLKRHIANLEKKLGNERTENLGFLKLAMNEAKEKIDELRP